MRLPNTHTHLGLAEAGVYNPGIMSDNPPHRQAVIFDMDGVLVDSYEAHFASWKQMLASQGLDFTREQFAESFGRTSREIIAENWPEYARDEQTITRWDRQKEQAYREILRKDLPQMPGAGPLIQSLHREGFALAIGSSAPPENLQVVLDGLDHSECFDAKITGSDVSRGKPDPEVFLKAAEALGVSPGQCVVVEDAPAGLEAARRAGMLPVALTGTAPAEALARKAHVVVDSLTQLTPETLRLWLESR
jgi:beta-phosphoglucomutase